MKIAIISDIHANLQALQATLKDIEKRNVDQIICLGDTISKGIHPTECLELVRSKCEIVLRGNCDRHFSTKHDNIDEMKMYFVICSSGGEHIEMAQTYTPFVDVKEGETYTFSFSWNIGNLAEGEYSFIPDLFSEDGNGNHWSVDHPMKPVRFKIVDGSPEGIKWIPSQYGHISANPILHIK